MAAAGQHCGLGSAGLADSGVRAVRGADRALLPGFYDIDDPDWRLREERSWGGLTQQIQNALVHAGIG